jgi:hypothetical protein
VSGSKVVRFGIVVEGQGEVDAVPLLIRRIGNEICGAFHLQTTRPVRITKTKLIRPGELERALQLAVLAAGPDSPIVVMLDADEDCPGVLGPDLLLRALPIVRGRGVTVVLPKHEFESWFLAAARSLAGKRGLRESLEPPEKPEEIRGAKEWLSRNMIAGRIYSPTVDQATLVAGMDLTAARTCQSFERFVREMRRLIA